MNISAWKIAIDRVKKEMRNSTIPFPNERMRLYKPLIKKYVCDEITGRFFRTAKMSKKEKQQVEQRDKQMSKYIHHLLQRSKNDRYFFAVGAGTRTLLPSLDLYVCFLFSTYAQWSSESKNPVKKIGL